MNKWNYVLKNNKKFASIKELKEGDEIISLDRYNNFVKSEITSVKNLGQKEILYIRTNKSYIQCDKDQNIFTVNKMVKASELNIGDEIITSEGFDYVKGIYNKGIEDCYKITASNGYLVNGILAF